MPQEIEDLIRQVSTEVKQNTVGNSVTFQQIIAISSDKKKNVEDWSAKDFFHYYVDLYERAVKQKYLITYATDLTSLKNLKSVFIKHTMDTSKDSFKKFLDWCFENRGIILKGSGNFLLSTFRKYINQYVADTQDINDVLPEEINFWQRLKDKAKRTNKFSDMLKIYGIPIMTTYMVQSSGKDEEYVLDRISKILDTQHSLKNMSDLSKIAKQSIALSPYPRSFDGLNWRECFIHIWEDIGVMEEDWWKTTDYRGRPAKHYQELENVQTRE